MKPTKPLLLISLFGVLAVATYLLTGVLVTRGWPIALSPTNLIVTLFAISILLLVISIPIWRYRNALKQPHPQRLKRVDPFYAVRVLLLAKAVAIAGSLFSGWHLGVLLYQLTGQVVIVESVIRNSIGLVASIVMVIAGLLTESICRLPDEPADKDPKAQAA